MWVLIAALFHIVTVLSQTITTTPSYETNVVRAGQATAVTACHFHGADHFCINGDGVEGSMVPQPTDTASAPKSYVNCHPHGATTFCIGTDGQEYQFVVEGESAEEADTESGSGEEHCHFHSGVEHCTGGDESKENSCERTDRDYNIPLRIGLLFVILVGSAIGAYGPIVLTSLFKFSLDGLIITILKQFGTGIIISTAFVHLMTHADLMWGSRCITLAYEATGTSITMAAIFITFLIEYLGLRLINSRQKKELARITDGQSSEEGLVRDEKNLESTEATAVSSTITDHHSHGTVINDEFSVAIMEAGIVFHSILLGITLVVAGDSYFITLFIVIFFHQMFEGIALGSRIVELPETKMVKKLIMAGVYSIVTPIGMAIGIGTLNKFNGNDPSTIIALGTLDSFSAGILIWTGLIELWAHDWIYGSLARSGVLKTCIALFSLVSGFIVMSALGKWA